MVLRFNEQLGAAMRRRRIELGMTQKEVADAAGVEEPQTVSRWERGCNMPSDLEAAAGALQWTVAEMMAGIQPPPRIARKLDIAPPGGHAPESSQLDRIQSDVAQIKELLTGASPEETIADLVARLGAAAGSPPQTAPGQSESSPEGRRRRPA